MRDTCAYLSMRYPQEFVQAVSIGAYCDLSDRYESFPMLDAGNGRVQTAAMLYAAVQTYGNVRLIEEEFEKATMAENWRRAERQLADAKVAESKEDGRRAEERQGKRERQRDQPWRKGHA